MMGATHRIGGLAAGMAAAALLKVSPAESGLLIAASLLGSLVPDIDNRHSSISRRFRLASVAVSMGQLLIRGISGLFPAKQRNYIRSLIGHRGLTHSLCPVALAAVLIAVEPYVATGAMCGIASHLVFDMLAGGVPLFMPFSTKRICLAHMKTGGMAELLFRVILIMIFSYFGWEVFLWQK